MNGEDEEETSLTSRKEETLSGDSPYPTYDEFSNENVSHLLCFRSMAGTVRGVRHRVRAGIATFLQDQTDKVTSCSSCY